MDLHRFQAIRNPEQRLQALRTAVAIRVVTGLSPQDVGSTHESFPLTHVLKLAAQSAFELQHALVTAESAKPIRMSAVELIRSLTFLVVQRFSHSRSDGPDFERAVHIDVSQCSDADALVLSAFHTFLLAMSQWMTAFYSRTPLHQKIHNLSANERVEFASICDGLATLLAMKFRKEPNDPAQRAAVASHLDRARELRTLAVLSRAPAAHTNSVAANWPARGEAHVFFLEAAPSSARCYGLAAFESDSVHFWCSSEWSRRSKQLQELMPGTRCTPQALSAAIEAVVSFTPSLRSIFTDQGRTCRARYVAFEDLTGAGLPLAVLFDPYNSFCTSLGGTSSHVLPVRADETRLGFWGGFSFRTDERMTVDEQDRSILADGAPLMRYPGPPNPRVRLRGYPLPLPYAVYEKWTMADLTARSATPFLLHSVARASRRHFLHDAPHEAAFLHITTHGEVDVDRVELSHLLFSEDNGAPTVVHFLDIVTRDWSAVKLVVLNVCQSAASRPTPGIEALSLGWSFLAAGAAAVVACRWPVEDHVAWRFAEHFYRYLLDAQHDKTVGEVFAQTISAVRNTDGCTLASQWGAFVLLTSRHGGLPYKGTEGE